jgi:hypothetical protein
MCQVEPAPVTVTVPEDTVSAAIQASGLGPGVVRTEPPLISSEPVPGSPKSPPTRMSDTVESPYPNVPDPVA